MKKRHSDYLFLVVYFLYVLCVFWFYVVFSNYTEPRFLDVVVIFPCVAFLIIDPRNMS